MVEFLHLITKMNNVAIPMHTTAFYIKKQNTKELKLFSTKLKAYIPHARLFENNEEGKEIAVCICGCSGLFWLL